MLNQTPPSDDLTINQPKKLPVFSHFGTLALIVGMVIAFFASQLVGVYLAGKLLLPAADSLTVGDTLFLGSNDGTIVSVSIIISCVILTLLSIIIIRSKGGDVRQYLALTPFSLTTGLALLGILLLFMMGSQALTYWLDVMPSAFVDPLYQSVSSVWLLMLALVIIAPIYEELVFRGLLWSAIAGQFSGTQVNEKSERRGAVIASIATSIIFATIHLQYGFYEISTIVLLALIFCYARIKSGSLLLPILLHMLNNGVAMWQYLLQVG
ncbi:MULTISPECIES: CPBP family intramembrane glutamic endopeptidase [Psychrobacter]|uniref:CPBP family intramembrane glutamic endopeptidase n=1 Tax=Psychrobacter TaxID=497 RepID=UPI00191B0BF8|nr:MULTISPECIES: CPBP family intramembrane glutamic endopeptidase [Psychrobacter]